MAGTETDNVLIKLQNLLESNSGNVNGSGLFGYTSNQTGSTINAFNALAGLGLGIKGYNIENGKYKLLKKQEARAAKNQVAFENVANNKYNFDFSMRQNEAGYNKKDNVDVFKAGS